MGFDLETEIKDREREAQRQQKKEARLAKKQAKHDAKCGSPSNASSTIMICPHCQTQMQSFKKNIKSGSGQALGCAVFFIGFLFLFLFPLGTIIGVLLMAGASGMGVTKKRGMRCPSCHYFAQTI